MRQIPPALARQLLDSPATREFVGYVQECINALSDYSDIDLDEPVQATVEMKARRHARNTLLQALDPLIGVNNSPLPQINRDDYVVE